MQGPKISHWSASLRVIKYIKSNPGLRLLMSSHKDPTLTRYYDVDWVACISTRRSILVIY